MIVANDSKNTTNDDKRVKISGPKSDCGEEERRREGGKEERRERREGVR